MFATIKVRKDDRFETLCFFSEEDAVRFQDFVSVYQMESGAGNGYGAYWIFDREIGFYREIPRSAVTVLEQSRMESMLHSILRARTGKKVPDAKVDMSMGKKDGAISFTLGDLPPRQRQ